MSGNLDLLRAVAVSAVFVAHFLGVLGFDNAGSLGRFGVIIFFVHTSLVLNASLERLEFGGFGSGWRLAASFWIRRLFRVYPLSIVFVALTAIFRIPASPSESYAWPGAKALLSNFGLVQNLFYQKDVLGPLWSLPLEVQMYAFLPFAYFIVRRRNRFAVPAMWILSVLLAVTVPRISGRLAVFSYAPCFTAGIVAFDLSRKVKWKLPASIWPLSILVVIFLFGPLDNISLAHKIVRAWFLSLALGIAAACIVEGKWPSINAAAQIVAKYSYGIYLCHVVVFWLVLDVLAAWPIWARGILLVGASVGAPIMCYRCIEQPLIEYGARLANRLKSKEKNAAVESAYRTVGAP